MIDRCPKAGERRKICVVTGSRAEYGLLRWLMEELRADDALTLQLIVTGAHLSKRHGETFREIENDGFAIDEEADLGITGDGALEVAGAAGLAVQKLARCFDRLAPHIVAVLGDRYEILAAAFAALLTRIPVAHIHGGEITEGAIDDAMRHAITKMAHLHFVSTNEHARRVIQLGEAPDRVFTVGALAVDSVARHRLLSRDALASELDLRIDPPFFLVTTHPATLGERDTKAAISALLEALSAFPDARVVFTGVNADPGHRAIHEAVTAFAEARGDRVRHFESLGQRRYLSVMALADVVVGNSSSGIIEAPLLKVPSVNIGNRQQGRPRTHSIIDVAEDAAAIRVAIETALSPQFRARAKAVVSPYGTDGVAERIVGVLASVDPETLVRKRFHDIPVAA